MVTSLKVNGYEIRNAIQRWEIRKDAAYNLFNDSLHIFEGQIKLSPDLVSTKITEAENAMAILQVAQSRYNLKVMLSVKITNDDNTVMTLCQAVKILGGAGRISKLWRESVSPKKDRYSYSDNGLERDSGKERAKSVLDLETRMARANEKDIYASSLRAAIASGNATSIDCEELQLDPKLLK